MSPAGFPLAVRRWVRRPLWWGAAALTLAGTLVVADVATARADDRKYDRGYRVHGRVAPGWDGGRDLDVTYVHPATGQRVAASTYLWHPSRRPRGGFVQLEVARDDPTDVVVAGDRFPATANLASYAPWVLFPFVVWAARRYTLGRTRRLMTDATTSYAMHATSSPPGWWGRRWRLHLFPLDASPSARAVCTVPLVSPPAAAGDVTVEVKGSPHAYGRVVAREADSGTVLWPSGRALRAPGPAAARVARFGPTSAPRAAAWIVGAAVALVVLGSIALGSRPDAEEVRARSRTVQATVTASRPRGDGRFSVDVVYDWQGDQVRGSVGEAAPAGEGERITVRIDPESPRRVWSTAQETPPGTSEGELGGLLITAGLVAGLAAGVLRYQTRRRVAGRALPAEAWRGLYVVDGRLWYGTAQLVVRRPRARFESDAFVLVEVDGSERRFAWDDHAAAAPAPAECSRWQLLGRSRTGSRTAAVDLQVGTELVGVSRDRRLSAFGPSDVLSEEMPALAAYLAATPAARAGLGDPPRLVTLVRELRSRSWRRPGPPSEPLLGDRLDVEVAVAAALDRRVRRFGGRLVRGEPVPDLSELVDEAMSRLPGWVRTRVTDEDVRRRVERHLATGRWPFDVLTVPPPPS